MVHLIDGVKGCMVSEGLATTDGLGQCPLFDLSASATHLDA